MNLSIDTYCHHCIVPSVASNSEITAAPLQSAIAPKVMRIGSAALVGLALSASTMEIPSFIEHQTARRFSLNTFDVAIGDIFGKEVDGTPERSWVSYEIANYLRSHTQVSIKDIDYVFAALHNAYGDVRIDVAVHTDPEEGWAKPVFSVHSSIEDFDSLMEIEDNFFAKAASVVLHS